VGNRAREIASQVGGVGLVADDHGALGRNQWRDPHQRLAEECPSSVHRAELLRAAFTRDVLGQRKQAAPFATRKDDSPHLTTR